MVKGYSYIRMSTDIQLKGDSLRRQMEMSKNYCENNNIELVESIQDIGISGFRGKNVSEGSLGKFLEMIKNGKISKGSCLIIESLDRLSRDKVLLAFSVFTDILSNGITIITLQDNQVYTSETVNNNPGQLFLSLGVMLRSHDESKTKSNRISSVWKHKRDSYNGTILTSRCPSWMKPKKDKSGFDLIESHSNTVKKIFQWSLNGDGSLVITRRLNDTKTPSIGKTKQWNKSYIAKILNNRSVLGEYQPHIHVDNTREPVGSPLLDYYPRVVSDVTFIKVQNGIKDRTNKGGRKGKSFSNLFSGIVYCDNCGSKLNYFNKGKKSKTHLWCLNSHHHKGCVSKPWNYHQLEDCLLTSLGEINIQELIDSDFISKNEELKDRIVLLKDDIKKQQRNLDDNTTAWFDSEPEIQKILEPKLKQLSITLDDRHIQLEDLKRQYDVVTMVELEKSKSQLVDFKNKLNSLKTDDDIYRFRSLVSNSISGIVSKLYIDTSMAVNPWEYDDLEVGFLEILRKKRYTTREKVETYLATAQGQRTFVEYEKTIKVIFRSGKVGWLKPSKDINIKFNKIDFIYQ
jgi:DNA invertase Pin-like site-specific DNA recombinase